MSETSDKTTAPPFQESSYRTSGHDPLIRIANEQTSFNDVFLGTRKQKGKLQRFGFALLSLAFLSVGLPVCFDSVSDLQEGNLFMFGTGIVLCIIGGMGLKKVIQD